MADVVPGVSPDSTPKWRPIGSLDRRVIGVLAEKAKTTPDQYPMTLNGLVTGCNQKSNRFPQMEVQPEDVEEALTRLREVGVVTEVQGGGRVAKFRHLLYEWLGVDKVELSVMTELLLRGAQTEGELRGRAARMDPIPDLNALRPLLGSLKAKGLVVSLTPEGRGHVLTHALYEPREMEKLKAEFVGGGHAAEASESAAPRAATSEHAPSSRAVASGVSREEFAEVQRELEDVRRQLSDLREEFDRLRSMVG
jgi:hypothetical protein